MRDFRQLSGRESVLESLSMPQVWPEALRELIFFPHMDEKLDDLAALAEPETWDYQHTPSDHNKPILFNYLRYTYGRLADEGKIVVSDDGQFIAFNTGLVTEHQEPLYLLANQNRFPNAEQPS